MNIKEWTMSIKRKLPVLSEKFSFSSIVSDDDDDMDEEEYSAEFADDSSEEKGGLLDRLRDYRRAKYAKYAAVAFLVIAVVLGFMIYDRLVTYDSYTIAASYENTVATGTAYVAAGKNILKYNADGITCVSKNNDVKWSVTYSMQSTIADTCDTTTVVAEQHGSQIYVVGEDGEIGHFETDSPIQKVRVSRQGVVAAVLQEDNVTWVDLYQADGTLIASDKTTMLESGYPLDVALSPNGENMAVSYVRITGGVLSANVSFYNFGTAGQEQENNLISSEDFEGSIIPEIYFVDNSHAVALTDTGYVVFQGSSWQKGAEVAFEDEILSCFHEDENIGFVFENEDSDNRYRIVLYNLRGKKKMEMETDESYSQIKMENGQILMYTDKSCAVYTASGHLRFQGDYKKEIVGFYYFSEYRKYLVITNESFDRIRIENGGEE
jgi:hypothetical protein